MGPMNMITGEATYFQCIPGGTGRAIAQVSRSPRGRAFQDIVIQSLECTLAETVGFLMFSFLDLFELDAKLL